MHVATSTSLLLCGNQLTGRLNDSHVNASQFGVLRVSLVQCHGSIPAGFYLADPSALVATMCADGTYSTGNATTCALCASPSGTVRAHHFQTSTMVFHHRLPLSRTGYACYNGSASASGLPCPVGTFGRGGTLQCQPCVVGTYSADTAQGACTPWSVSMVAPMFVSCLHWSTVECV